MAAGKVEVSILRRRLSESQSALRLIIAQAMLKDNKPDVIIRQITEMGIHEWVPFAAHRSVPVLNAQRIRSRKDRWEKIAIEALKQCRRSKLLKISDLLTYDAMLAYGRNCDIKLIFWEDESPSSPFELPDANCRIPFRASWRLSDPKAVLPRMKSPPPEPADTRPYLWDPAF